MKNKIIRTSNGIGFTLLQDRMLQRTSRVFFSAPYKAYRSDLQAALKTGSEWLNYHFWSSMQQKMIERHAFINEGMTQRNKKFISIGCMRFVGKSRTVLIRWAKSNKKGAK